VTVASDEPSPPLGRRARLALRLFGIALIGAALVYGYGYFVNVVVGLVEPVYVSPAIEALVVAEGLVALFLLAAGIASLSCRTRRGLWVLGALLALTAADIGVSFWLYPRAERSLCLHSLAVQREMGPDMPIDDSCLEES
jgi:hypothetical protein